MSNKRVLLFICLALCLLAGGIRFFRLGAWPFHGDELMTNYEVSALFHNGTEQQNPQLSRLPRMIPVSHALHYVGEQIFGADEFGTRVLPAIMGTLQVILVFLLLAPTAGRATALATALLIALWPIQLHHSQENRFYMTAALFASLCVLSGSVAIKRRSVGWTVLACAAALTALFSHTLMAVLWGGLLVSFLAAGWFGSRRFFGRELLVIGIWAAVAGLCVVFYIAPLAKGWNSTQSWGYDPIHSLMASVNQLGWPIALLAGLGAVLALQDRDEQSWYWLSWMAVWLGATVVLPFVVVYHPSYVFPLSLAPVVLAGRAVGRIFDGLAQRSLGTASAWVALCCLLNLPSLISHYADGSRNDLRAAAQHVSKHWQPGDVVGTYSPTLLQYYSPAGIKPAGVSPAHEISDLVMLTQGADRLWIVVPSTRTGKPEKLQKWLGENCSLEMCLRPQRIDYTENITEVFLYVNPNAPGLAREDDQPARLKPRPSVLPLTPPTAN